MLKGMKRAIEGLRAVVALKPLLALFLLFCNTGADALTISNRYRSPRNPERRLRPATRLIVLHTTEAHARSSLNKLSERGEAHYCLVEDGTVYRIIDRDRVAFHAGRSMWCGKEDCDDYAIGIEVVGYHDKAMPLRQLAALKELVDSLKKMYGLSDVQVVCHSHVAYGAPNKWQKCRHRGRKRCGMLFAMWSVRTRLGLKTRPAFDPDVKAGRLIQADKYLQGVLYGKTDTMAAHYAGGVDPAPVKPGGLLAGLGELFGLGADKKKPVPRPTAKPKPVENPAVRQSSTTKPKAGETVSPVKKTKAPTALTTADDVGSPDDWRAAAKFVSLDGTVRPNMQATTVEHPVMKAVPPKPGDTANYYLLPDGRYFQDDRLPKSVKLPTNTIKLVGYRVGGPLGPGKSAYGVVGKAWNAPTTYYVMGGKVYLGNKLKTSEITRGAMVFFKNH